MIFQSIVQLESYIKSLISIALKNISQKLSEDLKKIIETEYYDKYPSPKLYERTYQFLNSATSSAVSRAGNTVSVNIYVNYESLKYEEDDGYTVVELASQGYHGFRGIYREGFFWKTFEENYSEEVIKQMIIEELNKAGLKVI